MKDEMITGWISKYALSKGVFAADGTTFAEGMAFKYGKHGYAHGTDWHLTQDAALKKAESMRIKKIASLEKQIVSLRAMKFEAAK